MWFSNARSFDAIPQQKFFQVQIPTPGCLGYHERKKDKEKRRGRTTSSTAPKRARAHHQQPLMNLEEWYLQTPIVTRCYLTMSFLITAGCALEVKNNSFFYTQSIFRRRKIQSLCKPGAGKRAGLTRSLVLSLSLLRAGHLPVLGLLQLQPGLQRISILASGHQLFLLRRFGFRFHFPHVFPGEILPNARRRHVSRQIRGFFLDAPLRGVAVNDDCPVRKRAISGLQFNVHDGVRLGT